LQKQKTGWSQEMAQVIDLKKSQLIIAVRKGYRNWSAYFKEEFGLTTRFSQISSKTLSFLAQGMDKSTFFIYDLVMNLKRLGSGFTFSELSPQKKMIVIDLYLFLLDSIRFECMKRLKWLESYPSEAFTLVELIVNFDKLAPNLQAEVPVLCSDFPGFNAYADMNAFDKEVFIRRLIPRALDEIQDRVKP